MLNPSSTVEKVNLFLLLSNRNTWIEIRGKDFFGGKVNFRAEGLLARILQHEVDHLNGILICDRRELLLECEEFQLVDKENEYNA